MSKPIFKQAYFVTQVTVKDPETGGNVELEVYKHQNGGLFAMDASYLESESDDDSNMVMNDPFVNHVNFEWLVELTDAPEID